MMQADPNTVAAIAHVFDVGGVASLALYLLWRDLLKPWRNGRNGKQETTVKINGFAREADVTNLAGSFREFRSDIWDRVQDIGDRLSRLEGRMEGRGV